MSTARPFGAWKAAVVAAPSAWRDAPQPAIMVTAPSGATRASEWEWYDET